MHVTSNSELEESKQETQGPPTDSSMSKTLSSSGTLVVDIRPQFLKTPLLS